MAPMTGLWMQYYVRGESLVYDTLLGKSSFMYGFPLLAAGSCGFLQARRQLLEHIGTPKQSSYVFDKSQGVLLYAESKLLYFLFLSDARVACYQYLPSNIVLFGRLGELFNSMVPYAAHSDPMKLLELRVMQRLKPDFQSIGSNFPNECKPAVTKGIFLPETFFVNLTEGTGINANLYLINGQEISQPTRLCKGIWRYLGDLHVSAHAQ